TFAADTWHLAQLHQILGGDRSAQLIRTEHRKRCLSQLGPNPGSCQQELKELALVDRSEAVQGKRVLPHNERRCKRCPLSEPESSHRAWAADRLNAQTANLDHR